MDVTAKATTEHAIEYQGEDGRWVQWFASTDRAEAEREWRILQAVQPRVPIRRAEVEVIRDSRSDA